MCYSLLYYSRSVKQQILVLRCLLNVVTSVTSRLQFPAVLGLRGNSFDVSGAHHLLPDKFHLMLDDCAYNGTANVEFFPANVCCAIKKKGVRSNMVVLPRIVIS